MSKTISCELSTELKEAGAKQGDSEWVWIIPEAEENPALALRCCVMDEAIICDSFDCYELLMSLPRVIWVDEIKGFYFYMTLFGSVISVRYDMIKPIGTTQERRFNSWRLCEFEDESPAEALGKLKLWCLQEGHCKE